MLIESELCASRLRLPRHIPVSTCIICRYKDRFTDQMDKYFLCVPDRWHHLSVFHRPDGTPSGQTALGQAAEKQKEVGPGLRRRVADPSEKPADQ